MIARSHRFVPQQKLRPEYWALPGMSDGRNARLAGVGNDFASRQGARDEVLPPNRDTPDHVVALGDGGFQVSAITLD